eukprot:6549205-Karenia_brevis.AAC.1
MPRTLTQPGCEQSNTNIEPAPEYRRKTLLRGKQSFLEWCHVRVRNPPPTSNSLTTPSQVAGAQSQDRLIATAG